MSKQRSKTVVRPHFTFASLHGLSLVDRSLINEEPVGVPLLDFSLLGDCKELLANLHHLEPAHPTQPAQPAQPAQAAHPSEAASQLRARHASSAVSTHQPPWLFNSHTPASQHPKKCNNVLLHTPGPPDEAGGFSCVELTNGLTRIYRPRGGDGWEGWDMVESLQTHRGRLVNLVKNYILPQGYPDSVAPQYAEYMAWRGVQYFFGGAISVYTTKSLLGALGVAGRYSGEASAAINWVIKDGAGRLGRLLFARWGRELDCELKQFRLAGRTRTRSHSLAACMQGVGSAA